MTCDCLTEEDYPWIAAASCNHLACLKISINRDERWREDTRALLITVAINDSLECLIYLYEELHLAWDDVIVTRDWNLSERMRDYLNKVEDNWTAGVFPEQN